MSALGHEQTSRHIRVMSVITLKADIHQRGLPVCFMPMGDITLSCRHWPGRVSSGPPQLLACSSRASRQADLADRDPVEVVVERTKNHRTNRDGLHAGAFVDQENSQAGEVGHVQEE